MSSGQDQYAAAAAIVAATGAHNANVQMSDFYSLKIPSHVLPDLQATFSIEKPPPPVVAVASSKVSIKTVKTSNSSALDSDSEDIPDLESASASAPRSLSRTETAEAELDVEWAEDSRSVNSAQEDKPLISIEVKSDCFAEDLDSVPKVNITTNFEAIISDFLPQRDGLAKEYWHNFHSTKQVAELKKSILLNQWLISDYSPTPAPASISPGSAGTTAETTLSTQVAQLIESCGWKYVSLWEHTNDLADLHRAVAYLNVIARYPEGKEVPAMVVEEKRRAEALLGLLQCNRSIYERGKDIRYLSRAIAAGEACVALTECPPDVRETALWGVLDCLIILNTPKATRENSARIYWLLQHYQPKMKCDPGLANHLADCCDKWKIPATTIEKLSGLLYGHYEEDPNSPSTEIPQIPEVRLSKLLYPNSPSTKEPQIPGVVPASKDVLDMAIELLRAAIGRLHALPEAESERIWWKADLSLMLAQRYRRKLTEESYEDLSEAVALGKEIENGAGDLPPGNQARIYNLLANQVSLLYNPRNPSTVESLDQAIILQTKAVTIGRQILRGEVEIVQGDKDPGDDVLEWTVKLERLLVRKLQFHVDMGQEAGCEEVGRLVDAQLEDVLRSTERIREREQWLGRAQAMLTRAWQWYIHHTQPKKAVDPMDGGNALNDAIGQALQALVVANAQPKVNSYVVLNILDALSVFYLARYDSGGDLDDLRTAATYARKGIKKLKNQPNSIAMLHLYLRACHSVAAILVQRFRATGAHDDLREAIKFEAQAVNNACADRLLQSTYQITLSQYLELHFEVLRDSQADDALQEHATLKLAVELVADAFEVTDMYGNQQMRLASRNSLCSLSATLYEYTGNEEDFKAMNLWIKQTEIVLTHKDFEGTDKLCLLSTLSHAYSLCKESDSMTKAVQYAQKAVDECPKEHFQRAELNFELGKLLSLQYKGKLVENETVVVGPLKTCLDIEDAPPSFRLKAASLAAKILTEVQGWNKLYTFTKKAMDLMPLLCIKALPQRDQQSALKDISGLGSIAAAAALQLDHPAGEALALIEYGRDVIASNRFDTRVDVTKLRQKHPKLAERFETLREELDPAGVGVRMNLRADSRYTGFGQSDVEVNQISSKLLQVNHRYRSLLEEIRTKDEFKEFLKRPDENILVQAAGTDGAIVVVNVTGWRSDALIVRKGQAVISCSLPDLTEAEVDDRLKDAQFNSRAPINLSGNDTLYWMWDEIAKPVLESLGDKYSKDYSPSAFDTFSKTAPRIWWLMTRNTSRLPIHAAMSKLTAPSTTRSRVVTRAISSYITSIKALIFARQQLAARVANGTTKGKNALLCGLPTTTYNTKSKLRPLRKARDEAETIKGILEGPMNVRCWVDPAPEAQAVLSALSPPAIPIPSVFHFAGHGKSDPFDPALSQIYLFDEPLTVDLLLRARLYTTAPILAYLSACSTGTATLLPDESVHVMSGFISAGFMNVIGTLWDTNDDVSYAVATNMYRRWVESGLNPEDLGRCLHYAVAKTQQDRTNRTALTQAASADNWACFVHMGV